MKANEPSGNDQAQLQPVLREWVVDTPLPPRFQEHVWRRIGQLETRTEKTGVWARLSLWIESGLPRPRVAASYVALLLALGVAGGSLAAQFRNHQLNAALSHRYVQSIDPYHSETPQP